MKLSELLQILLNNVNLVEKRECGLYGLKWYTLWLYDDDIVKIDRYIKRNILFNRRWYAFWHRGYWWKPGLIEPRKKWLEKHIKKLKAKGL